MSRLTNLKKQIILEANIKLSEQAAVANKAAVTPAVAPAKPVVDLATLKPDYMAAMETIWFQVRNTIVFGGLTNGKSNGIMQWKYPEGTKEKPAQLHKPDGSVADQAILSAYDALFNQKLNALCEDAAKLKTIADLAFAKNQTKAKNINFQTYLMTLIQDKTLVKDNGEGGPFNDGIFHAVTTKAAIKFRLEQNYRDSAYMLGKQPPLL
jgi:hypothetical protein